MPGDVAAAEWRQVRVGDAGNEISRERRRSTSSAGSAGMVGACGVGPGGDEGSVGGGDGGGLQVRNLSTGDVDVIVPGAARGRASTEGDALLVGGKKVRLSVYACRCFFCTRLQGFTSGYM